METLTQELHVTSVISTRDFKGRLRKSDRLFFGTLSPHDLVSQAPPLDVNHLSTIKTLTQKYKGKIYADKFEKLLKDLIHDVESRINFVFDDDTNANLAHTVARPFYHPLYGACATVDLDDREGVVTSLVVDIAPKESLFKNLRLDKRRRKRQAVTPEGRPLPPGFVLPQRRPPGRKIRPGPTTTPRPKTLDELDKEELERVDARLVKDL